LQALFSFAVERTISTGSIFDPRKFIYDQCWAAGERSYYRAMEGHTMAERDLSITLLASCHSIYEDTYRSLDEDLNAFPTDPYRIENVWPEFSPHD
jgi:hypothetical protein